MTRASDREVQDLIGRSLNNWAGEGTLPTERSYQLERLVYDLSHGERRGRLAYVLRGAIAALAAYITMLFLACPAAGSIGPAIGLLADSASSPAAHVEQVVYIVNR